MPGTLHCCSRAQDPSIQELVDFIQGVHWTLTWNALGTGDVTIDTFIGHAVANATQAPAAICMSNQVPFFACTTCRKLVSWNTSKCISIFLLWQIRRARGHYRKSRQVWPRRMPGGSYKWIKAHVWEMSNASSAFLMHWTVAEGGKLGTTELSHGPVASVRPSLQWYWYFVLHLFSDTFGTGEISWLLVTDHQPIRSWGSWLQGSVLSPPPGSCWRKERSCLPLQCSKGER